MYRVWWDLRLNTVLIGDPRRPGAVELVLRRDSRLASRYEKQVVSSLVGEMFGVQLPVNDRIMLLHRTPSQGYAVEVYYDAVRIGVLEHTAPPPAWIFHPYASLAHILVGLGAHVNFEANIHGRIKGKKLSRNEYRAVSKPTSQWGIVAAGRALGVARLESDGSLRVRDIVRANIRPLSPSQPASNYNKAYLAGIEEETIGFLHENLGDKDRVYTALSGGMDSEAAAILAAEALGPSRVEALHIDTGIGFRDAGRHAERIASMLGLKLTVLRAGEERYWDELRRRGLNTRDNRWCTWVLKLEPVKQFFAGRRHHVVEGLRIYESDSRARLRRIRRNPLIPGQTQYFPILRWPRFYVQLFLEYKGMPVNPLYDEGLERIGCAVCPAMHLYELLIARRLEPSIHSRFIAELSSLLGLEESCVEMQVYSARWRSISKRGAEAFSQC